MKVRQIRLGSYDSCLSQLIFSDCGEGKLNDPLAQTCGHKECVEFLQLLPKEKMNSQVAKLFSLEKNLVSMDIHTYARTHTSKYLYDYSRVSLPACKRSWPANGWAASAAS